MQTAEYFIIDNEILFKLRPTADGSFSPEALNPATGQFELAPRFLPCVFGRSDRDTVELTEAQFNAEVKRRTPAPIAS
ncbi:hypothetical protein [Deinococcus cellulosilyticus]|uniref:Uncharacterized protein n=1 Tax=Deinococcus cellulosilyticus (strain DSM 18568 / NBRC 106333 / KACC 11606 / 5516J-15) TaxID=1223518 RepID=A0A511N824_DEIC1|nr:hypothetical protein [Deinococcus cellulosilyticus]GEM48657.1 hypothetical protein DC3_42920 [Deinococcus cellulosilyticus NBRC 106333 = KACC 11606]